MGTILSTVKLDALNAKWLKKKEDNNIFKKEEANKLADMTPEERMIKDFNDRAEGEKEASKLHEIQDKIASGGTLTPEEEAYLNSKDPQSVSKYKQMKVEKKNYAEKLKRCKSKDEVERLKHNTLNGYLSSFKKIENNPNIPMSEKFAQAMEMLGKAKNIEVAEVKFKASAKYANLKTEGEISTEREKEREAKAEAVIEGIKDTVIEADEVKEKNKDKNINKDDNMKVSIEDIEEAVDSLSLKMRLEDIDDIDVMTDYEKKIGGHIDYSL